MISFRRKTRTARRHYFLDERGGNIFVPVTALGTNIDVLRWERENSRKIQSRVRQRYNKHDSYNYGRSTTLTLKVTGTP